MNQVITSVSGQVLATSEALLLPFRAGRRWVDFGQIVRLEAMSNYTTCIFADGSQLVVAITLKQLTARIPAEQFVRLHKSHLVNRVFIEVVQQHRSTLVLSNGDTVAISRRKATNVLREFQPKASTNPKHQPQKLSINPDSATYATP